MSRCFLYPPPGYEAKNREVESIKLEKQREKAAKERRKEKKREKKEKTFKELEQVENSSLTVDNGLADDSTGRSQGRRLLIRLPLKGPELVSTEKSVSASCTSEIPSKEERCTSRGRTGVELNRNRLFDDLEWLFGKDRRFNDHEVERRRIGDGALSSESGSV